MLHAWEAELAQSVPQRGATGVTLLPEDFVVSVSFSAALFCYAYSLRFDVTFDFRSSKWITG